MRDVKCDDTADIKGCISYVTGDRNYYGLANEVIMNKNKSYYSNSQYYILDQFK